MIRSQKVESNRIGFDSIEIRSCRIRFDRNSRKVGSIRPYPLLVFLSPTNRGASFYLARSCCTYCSHIAMCACASKWAFPCSFAFLELASKVAHTTHAQKETLWRKKTNTERTWYVEQRESLGSKWFERCWHDFLQEKQRDRIFIFNFV